MYVNLIQTNYAKISIEPSFKAMPLAEYRYLGNNKKNVIIYQLEKRDIKYLKNILDNIIKFFVKYEITDESTKEIFKATLEASIKLLENPAAMDDKTKIFLGLSGNDPSAILVGNVQKTDKKGNIHYSSRKNHAKNETELDGLAAWNNKIPREGKAILCEYFYSFIKDGFKHLYIRSEIPKYSYAVKFYKSMGLKVLSKKLRPMLRKNENTYIIDIFNYGNSLMVPMKATIKDIMHTIDKQSKILRRKPISSESSVTLPEIEF